MKRTQKEVVLDYMRVHNGITSMEAFELGITRLSSVIWYLKKDGYTIKTETVKRVTRYGNVAEFARYYLGEIA